MIGDDGGAVTSEDIYLAAARAYCVTKFDYDAASYWNGDAGRERHIEYDAAGTAEDPWLRAVVDAVVAGIRP